MAQSSGDEIQVSVGQLRAHAASVASVAADVDLAVGAVESVHFDALAYGLFCQALPLMMEPLKQTIGAALTTEDLRAVADPYQARRDDSARQLREQSS